MQNLIPSFPWIAPTPALHPGAIQGKEGIKFCHLATLPEAVVVAAVVVLVAAVGSEVRDAGGWGEGVVRRHPQWGYSVPRWI